MGFEVGYQMALSAKAKDLKVETDQGAAATAAALETDEFKKNKKNVEDAAKEFGKTSVPYINLIRLGWLL